MQYIQSPGQPTKCSTLGHKGCGRLRYFAQKTPFIAYHLNDTQCPEKMPCISTNIFSTDRVAKYENMINIRGK